MKDMTKTEVDEVVDFLIKYFVYTDEDRPKLEHLIKKHEQFKTLLIINDPKDGIVGMARWNVLPTGRDVHMLEVVIHPDWVKKNLMLRMVLQGVKMYPDVEYIIFERRLKNMPFKKVSIKWLLSRRF